MNDITFLIPQNPKAIAYFLPVEPMHRIDFGKAPMIIESMGLHEKYNLACAFPAFEKAPWINREQEYNLVKSAQEFNQKPFLVGFSKGGFAAMNLLFRNPDVFSGAISWDAPLMFNKYSNAFGLTECLGDDIDAFTPSKLVGYHIPNNIRIFIGGSNRFPEHTEDFHELLNNFGLEHIYDPYMPYRHHWNSPWIDKCLQAYLNDELT